LTGVTPATARERGGALRRQAQLPGDVLVRVHHDAGEAPEPPTVLDDRYPLAVDGTGQFASSAIACPHCCIEKVSKKMTSHDADIPGLARVGGGG